MYICHKFKIMSDKVTAYSPLPQLGRPHYNIIRPSGGGGGGEELGTEELKEELNSRQDRDTIVWKSEPLPQDVPDFKK